MQTVARHGRGAGRAVPADQRPGQRRARRWSSCAAVVVGSSSADVGAGRRPGRRRPRVVAACWSGPRCCAPACRPPPSELRAAQHARARLRSRSPSIEHGAWCAGTSRCGRASQRYVCPAISRSLRRTSGRDRSGAAARLQLGAAAAGRSCRPASHADDQRRELAVRRLRRGPDQPPGRRAPATGAASRSGRRRSYELGRAGRPARRAWPEIAALAVPRAAVRGLAGRLSRAGSIARRRSDARRRP